jgi:hypothetical protein
MDVNFAVNEIPTGIVNATNTVFQARHTPVNGTLVVYLNEYRQEVDVQYSLAGGIVTFYLPPLVNDRVRFDYQWRSGSRILYISNSDDYLLLTPPAAVSSLVDVLYPIENLTTLPISNPTRFTGHVAQIGVDLVAQKAVSLIALIAHNLSSTAIISIFAGTTAACSSYATTIPWRESTCFRFFDPGLIYRYWKILINDDSNVDGQIDIGRLIFGNVSEINRMSFGSTKQRVHVNDIADTEFGTSHVARVYRATKLFFPFSEFTASEVDDIVGMVNYCEGSLTPLFLIPDTESTDGYFGKFTEDPAITIDVYRSTNINFMELSPGRWIKELQPLIWLIGHILPSSVFTRTGVANYINAASKIVAVATDVIRSGNHPSVILKSMLLERATTNVFTAPSDLSNAAWSKAQCSISTNVIAGPDDNVTADKIVEDGTNDSHGVYQTITGATDNTKQAISFHVKAAGRTICMVRTKDKAGNSARSWFDLTNGIWGTTDATHTVTVDVLANGWFRLGVVFDVSAGGTTPWGGIFSATEDAVEVHLGDAASGIYVVLSQLEVDAPQVSSYTATTRNDETLYFVYTTTPRFLTNYVRFVESGSILTQGNGIFHIGLANNTGAKLQIVMDSGFYSLIHNNGSSSVSSTHSVTPSIGDVVELRAVLYSDGAVQLFQSINGAAEIAASKSAALSMAVTWGADRFYLNSTGTTNLGINNFISVKSLRGLQTIDYCRTAV